MEEVEQRLPALICDTEALDEFRSYNFKSRSTPARFIATIHVHTCTCIQQVQILLPVIIKIPNEPP